jgi:hypothetical protein
MLPTKFRFIWPSGFRGEDLKKSANQKQELPVVASNLKTITLMNDYEIIMYCFVTYGYLLPSLGVRLLSSVVR